MNSAGNGVPASQSLAGAKGARLSRAQCAAAAKLLVAARRSGQAITRLPPDCRPADIDSALDIQSEVSAMLGDPVGAWKCGLPGVDTLVAAPIYAGTLQQTSSPSSPGSAAPPPVPGLPVRLCARNGLARVEPELAFIIGHDLPPRSRPYTQEEMVAAIGATHLALELIGSRYADLQPCAFPEMLADGLVNQGLLLGPAVPQALTRDLEKFTVSIEAPSGRLPEIAGRHPAGHPFLPYFWLVAFLNSRGLGLSAGQAVITGSYAGCLELPLATPWTVTYGGLGSLTVEFEGR